MNISRERFKVIATTSTWNRTRITLSCRFDRNFNYGRILVTRNSRARTFYLSIHLSTKHFPLKRATYTQCAQCLLSPVKTTGVRGRTTRENYKERRTILRRIKITIVKIWFIGRCYFAKHSAKYGVDQVPRYVSRKVFQ